MGASRAPLVVAAETGAALRAAAESPAALRAAGLPMCYHSRPDHEAGPKRMDDRGAKQEGAATGGGLLLDFDAWAELAARLVDLPMPDKVRILDERDIELEDWLRSDRHHLAAIAADAAAKRMDRAQAYARLCVAEMERRASAAGEATVGPPPAGRGSGA